MKRLLNLFFLMVFGVLSMSCDGDATSSQGDGGVEDDTTADSGSDTENDTENGTLRGACPSDRALGVLEVSVVADFSSISGAFSDGVVPASVPTREMEEGDCVLWRRQNPTCNPPCISGETCDFDGNCIPYPLQQDAGVITIDGLSDPVSLEPLPPGNSYSMMNITHPAFEPGALIEMTSTDGYFGVLNMRGVGVEPLVDQALSWTIASGQPLTVTWRAPAEDTGSQMNLYLNIDQHGHSPLTMVCDFPDVGHAEISASLIDALITTGVSGKPSGRLTRRTVDSVDVADGCVEFQVTSTLKANVQVTDGAR